MFKGFLIITTMFLFTVNSQQCVAKAAIKPKQKLFYQKPAPLTGAALSKFNKVFLKNWQNLKLDMIMEDDGSEAKALKFVEPLPIYDLDASCAGSRLYYLDFAEYSLVDKAGEKINLGEGYTGSAGTRRLVLALNEQTQKMKILFDDNIIDFFGVSDEGKDCPELYMEFSGGHFNKSKYNSEYGIAKVSYILKSSEYEAGRDQLHEGLVVKEKAR